MNKIAVLLSRGDKMWYDVTPEVQSSYLSSLRQPRDTIDRGWLQYKCQMYFVTLCKKILINCISIVSIPILICLLFLRKNQFVRKINAIGEFKGLEEVIPLTVSTNYSIDNSVWDIKGTLRLSDLGFCFRLVYRYPLSPLFIAKCILKISKYSSFITSYKPDAILVHNEYSYTSSVLTEYCREHGVLHINIMHGEKLFNIRDSFFEYDKCYVWNEHYVQLFSDLRADIKQFTISLPPSIKIDVDNYIDSSVYADFKYFLADFNEYEIKCIVASMKFALENGQKVKYRPHPRYSNIALLKKYVADDDIEYPDKVSIFSSVSNLKYAVGSYSTVLLQAYFSGKQVVCDDITYKRNFEHLSDYRWILSDAKTKKISDFQNEKNN